MTKEYYAQHRIGNSGADSNKLNICNSIGHLCKSWADVLQMPHHRQYVTVMRHFKDETTITNEGI